MRLLVQRVRRASVAVEERNIAAIGPGLLVLVGFGGNDTPALPHSRAWNGMLDKVLHARIFPGAMPDKIDKMDRNVADFGGEVLLVSQFTLYADCRKGRRPDFQSATPPLHATVLFEHFVRDMNSRLAHRVQSGIFGAQMDIALVNWGPVTLFLDSTELFPTEQKIA